MQALILVGGKGTRLRPLTHTIPKPVLPLVDRPFIGFMIEWLARHGVDEIVLACGSLPDKLREVLGDGGDGGPRLTYVEEPDRRGTAGAIKFAEEHLQDRFLALNGDVLTDLDLTALIRFHEERGAQATLGLYPVEDPSGYGLVSTDPERRIREFTEKPGPGHAGAGEINAGLYVLERSVLEQIPAGREISIERELFPQLVGHGLYGLRLDGYWMDIGTPDRYLQASWDILEGNVETEVGKRLGGSDRLVVDGALLADDADVAGPALVGPGVRIGAAATVGPRAVVMAGAEVGEGAEITSSVLLDGSVIGPGAVLFEAIIGPGAQVDAEAQLGPGTVVAAGDTIPT
jgi:mannose-1-phosphate guanylyltransferase